MSKEPQISTAELERDLGPHWQELLAKMVKAFNEARAGAIISDSEEIVRQAMAEFRQKAYEHGVQLMADKAAKAAFSPCAQSQERAKGSQQRPSRR